MAKDLRPPDKIRQPQGLAQRLWCRIAVGLLCAATAVLFEAPAAAQGPTVEAIVKRGQFLCSGATVNSPGFAAVDAGGHWKGMDVDICRALTVAILGDETKLSLVPVSFVQRFPALQSSDIDVIAKNTAWTLTRTADLGLQYSWPYYYLARPSGRNQTRYGVPSSDGIGWFRTNDTRSSAEEERRGGISIKACECCHRCAIRI